MPFIADTKTQQALANQVGVNLPEPDKPTDFVQDVLLPA